MKIDLHTHTSVSDGSLSPAELVHQAELVGIDILSITDHDSVEAYTALQNLSSSSLTLIPGIEFSTEWKKLGVHIVGLNIQLDSDAIREGVKKQHQARLMRAQRIAEKLDNLGFENSWEGVKEIAGDSVIGRPHFARLLIKNGVVKDFKQAFDKYLGAGKAGDVKQFWASFEQVIQWIRDAKGIAILAHPHKYKLTRTKLSMLLDDFREAGGEGMEVLSGKQTADVTQKLARLCQQKDLLASCGSDFHQPGQPWSELGNVQSLPLGCKVVWENWR
ncbi:MAG: putative metal-dependent phosphoesterase TrpH [Gammaproteobacteria bacterium]|jgi:predicted metal-dependent phosphoesterase TrpH